MHAHYVKSWIFSLVTFMMVCTEIMTMLFFFYGPRFIEEGVSGAIIDIGYYIVVFGWFTGCAVFGIRTYELTERESFYGKYQQEQETKAWKRLLEDIPEPIIFTRDGRVTFFNEATLSLFDFHNNTEREGKEDIVLEELANFKEKGTKRTLKEYIENMADSMLRKETIFSVKKNDEKQWYTVKCVHNKELSGDGQLAEYILHDVSALKALERNHAEAECFDLLLATASHDIRTPLNILLGVIDVLSEFVQNSRGVEQINVARCCGQRMIYYLKGLTFIRQINLKTLLTVKKLFNPVEMIRCIITTVYFSAEAKGIKVELDSEPGLPRSLCSDREMYEVALYNILENAVKYTFSGVIKVSLKYHKSNNVFTTEVCDTGIGMDRSQLANAGTLFTKNKNRCGMNPQGIGLGLFLAKSLAQHLNGSLEIRSDVDEGTAVSFSFSGYPIEEATIERKETDPSPLSTNLPCSFDCECTKILLVDDEPLNLMVLSAYLSSYGFKADRAENGQIALDLITNRTTQECCKGYGIIFMDINMPVMDGITATMQIMDLIKEGKIPACHVVAVTAATGLDSPSTYANYISKGFTQLRKIIFSSFLFIY